MKKLEKKLKSIIDKDLHLVSWRPLRNGLFDHIFVSFMYKHFLAYVVGLIGVEYGSVHEYC